MLSGTKRIDDSHVKKTLKWGRLSEANDIDKRNHKLFRKNHRISAYKMAAYIVSFVDPEHIETITEKIISIKSQKIYFRARYENGSRKKIFRIIVLSEKE